MVDGAGDIVISFGYGSCHDTTCLTGFICDQCAIAFTNACKVPMTHSSPLSGPERFNAVEYNHPGNDSTGEG